MDKDQTNDAAGADDEIDLEAFMRDELDKLEASESGSSDDVNPADDETAAAAAEIAGDDNGSDENVNTDGAENGDAEQNSGDEAPADAGKAEDAEGKTEAEERAAAEEAVTAPERWTDEEKAKFAALPPDMQKFVSDRYRSMEADYTKKTQEHAAKIQLADQVGALVTDEDRRALQARGQTEVDGLKGLVELHRFSQQDPAGYLRYVAQSMQAGGIDVAKALGFSQQPDDAGNGADEFVYPETRQLNERLDKIEAERKAQREAEQRREFEIARGEATTRIEAFKAETDEAGQAKHPHYDALEPTMAHLIETGQAKDLADAYEQATWRVPGVREQILSSQRAAAEKAAAEKAAREAETARKAAASNIRGGSQPTRESRQIANADDAINAAWDETFGA